MALQASLPKVNVDTQPYRYDEKADFTGGLNLRADQFNIGANESPAMLNVEVDPRGGVRRRDGVTKINSDVVEAESGFGRCEQSGYGLHPLTVE